MLVAHHLLLLLKVGHNLRQRLLQDLNLVLVRLNFTSLHLCALLVLLFRAGVDSDISLDLLISLLLILYLLLVLLQFVALRDSLQSQRLVLLMDLTLNGLNSCAQKKTHTVVRHLAAICVTK